MVLTPLVFGTLIAMTRFVAVILFNAVPGPGGTMTAIFQVNCGSHRLRLWATFRGQFLPAQQLRIETITVMKLRFSSESPVNLFQPMCKLACFCPPCFNKKIQNIQKRFETFVLRAIVTKDLPIVG
jgi:hypothetical protein